LPELARKLDWPAKNQQMPAQTGGRDTMAANPIGNDVLFILLGAILVFAMHGGFAFLEAGTVRHKNQVNALVKILADFAISTTVYFLVGYFIAYGVHFFHPAAVLSGQAETPFQPQGYALVKFFFLATFAAAVPAIISGGIAERMKFSPQLVATAILVGLVYPLFEGIVWNGNFGIQDWLKNVSGVAFHDFAGSIVVHAVGGWIALGAVITLGPRMGRYLKSGKSVGIPPSSIPWLALGSWLLCTGWFGFNVMSAQTVASASGLVAMNSLMAMVGGILSAQWSGRNDPGFIHNGALAGLVAVCAGSDLFHPVGAFVVGGAAGVIFVKGFHWCQEVLKIDDVLGVWPLHGLCGLWGGIAAGIFGQTALGGMGGVSFLVQLAGSLAGAAYAGLCGYGVYQVLNRTLGLRLTDEQEYRGADLTIHKIGANPEHEIRMV
jgi:Amt family ammonium transporter